MAAITATRCRLDLPLAPLHRETARVVGLQLHVVPGQGGLGTSQPSVGQNLDEGEGQRGATPGRFRRLHPSPRPRLDRRRTSGTRLRLALTASATTGCMAGFSPFCVPAAAWKWKMAERACWTVARDRPVAAR